MLHPEGAVSPDPLITSDRKDASATLLLGDAFKKSDNLSDSYSEFDDDNFQSANDKNQKAEVHLDKISQRIGLLDDNLMKVMTAIDNKIAKTDYA